MNCYDCLNQGLTREAVAICASCGAAVCQNCTCLESVDPALPSGLDDEADGPAEGGGDPVMGRSFRDAVELPSFTAA